MALGKVLWFLHLPVDVSISLNTTKAMPFLVVRSIISEEWVVVSSMSLLIWNNLLRQRSSVVLEIFKEVLFMEGCVGQRDKDRTQAFYHWPNPPKQFFLSNLSPPHFLLSFFTSPLSFLHLPQLLSHPLRFLLERWFFYYENISMKMLAKDTSQTLVGKPSKFHYLGI